MKRIIYAGFAMLLSWIPSVGQNVCKPLVMEVLEGPNVRAVVQNGANMFWNKRLSPFYQVPIANPVDLSRNSAFATGFWIGGVDNLGNPRVAASMFDQKGVDFFPGSIRNSNLDPCMVPALSLQEKPNEIPPLRLSDGKVVFPFWQKVKIWDPVQNSLQIVALPTDWNDQYQMAQMGDGRVLIAFDGPFINPSSSPTLVMDTVNWAVSNYLPLSSLHPNGKLVALANGDVLIASKFSNEILHPFTNTLSAAGNFVAPMEIVAIERLPNGKVLAFPELSTNNVDSTTIQVYDPQANSWSLAGNLLKKRRNISTLVLPDSSVLILGSMEGGSTIERYFPNTQTTIPISIPSVSMPLKTCAMLVENGEVLIWPLGEGKSSPGRTRTIWKYHSITQQVSVSQTMEPIGHGIYLGGHRALVPVPEEFDYHYFWLNTRDMTLLNQRYQKIWKVSQSEIDQFQSDFANGTLNFGLYPDIETWPAHGDVLLGESPNLAPFVDVDGNGQYEPSLSGDYPCIRGTQSLWWVMNDSMGFHSESESSPLGVEVSVMAYTVDCNSGNCPDSFLNYSTFYHYTIHNKSNQDYSQTRLGIFHSAALGSIGNDYIGCDTLLDMGFVYNADPVDFPMDVGYGPTPPALGFKMLHTPNHVGMGVFREMGLHSAHGLPSNPAQYYQMMRPYFLDGNPMVDNGGNGYPGNGNGPITHFLYPGDAGFCGGPTIGWSETSANNPHNSRDLLETTHPFELPANSTVEFDLAILWAQGNDNLESVCLLKQLGAATQPWWDALQSTSCNLNTVGIKDAVKARPTPLEIYPNPSDARSKIRVEQPLREATITVWSQMGQMVQSFDWPAGDTEFELDGMNLPSGLYHVLVTSATAKYHANWVIER